MKVRQGRNTREPRRVREAYGWQGPGNRRRRGRGPRRTVGGWRRGRRRSRDGAGALRTRGDRDPDRRRGTRGRSAWTASRGEECNGCGARFEVRRELPVVLCFREPTAERLKADFSGCKSMGGI
jgi:hypothetical protein